MGLGGDVPFCFAPQQLARPPPHRTTLLTCSKLEILGAEQQPCRMRRKSYLGGKPQGQLEREEQGGRKPLPIAQPSSAQEAWADKFDAPSRQELLRGSVQPRQQQNLIDKVLGLVKCINMTPWDCEFEAGHNMQWMSKSRAIKK